MCRHPDRERGSTLLLFPAAFLIMIALAAMTVDNAVAFLARRELLNATAAAANDAATLAVSDTSFYQGNRVELSPSGVRAVAVDRINALVDRSRHHGLVVQAEAVAPVRAGCAWTVRVTASSQVDKIFARALPGSDGQVAVKAQSTASPQSGVGGC